MKDEIKTHAPAAEAAPAAPVAPKASPKPAPKPRDPYIRARADVRSRSVALSATQKATN